METILSNKVIIAGFILNKLFQFKSFLKISILEKKCDNYETFFDYYIIFHSNLSYIFVETKKQL
jgi:hypothetical protein